MRLRRKLTPTQVEEILWYYEKTNITIRNIAKHYKIHNSHVSNIAYQHGLRRAAVRCRPHRSKNQPSKSLSISSSPTTES